ncbi:MAG: response regulator [Planctomycetes bacterium]|nr:response regulator [Planctomycetota bacterium]MBL7106911.1 response regulator [Phycisphaerae bacterium]
MDKETLLLVAEDDDGHFSLIKRNLERAGIRNELVRFKDGQEVLDYLFGQDGVKSSGRARKYLLLLDIKMPKIDGITVLERIRQDEDMKKMPVIIVTTSDQSPEIDRCHELGTSVYVVKPTDYEDFGDAIQKIGLFLSVVRIPKI